MIISKTKHIKDLRTANVKAERWRIAYDVLEQQYNEYAEQSERMIESLQMTIADLLRERNERIDKALQ